ncbi:MAG: methylated-DNA--[protein]-cysteine S-methyltransferase [Thermodesulforhabdaceae bacterium]
MFTEQAVMQVKWLKEVGEQLETRKKDQLGRLANQIIREFSEYWEGRRKIFSIPYIFSIGTPFQHRVWQQIASIPYGSTISYGRLSLLIKGTSLASRAVGQACAKNPLPLIIPCHRVVKSDGSPGYYLAPDGALLKAKLIAFEKENK